MEWCVEGVKGTSAVHLCNLGSKPVVKHGLIIRRAVGRCPAGSGWRWAGGGRVGGGMGPDLDRGEANRREGAERLALMDRAWEDALEETDYATQDGSGGGTQESEGTQRERSRQAPDEAGEAGAMASRLLESMEDVRREVEHLGTVGDQGGGTAEARSGGARAGIGGLSQAASSVEDILNEWDDLLSPGLESGVWTQEQSGASPEQAMALAEGGVATLMGASRRVAGLLGGLMAWGGLMRMTGEMWGGPRVELTHAGPLRARGPIPAAMTTYNRRKSVADAQVWMRATQFIILSPLGQRLGILAVAWTQQQCAGRTAAEGLSSRGRDEPASGTRRQCAGGADAEGLGWLSEA
ncbi:hypothetical protein CYMTET_9004 [Cymbomonas tetramitiformis]|uniref:Uncharacterized protein n=1 Tax=Cymbomonas tetramitiformis TaxID=36881 RepID=A0AAE0GRX1_9CHLO|nr:hypothetical protein CYMTET_9004 [Cymbomonas tetramitiformis]